MLKTRVNVFQTLCSISIHVFLISEKKIFRPGFATKQNFPFFFLFFFWGGSLGAGREKNLSQNVDLFVFFAESIYNNFADQYKKKKRYQGWGYNYFSPAKWYTCLLRGKWVGVAGYSVRYVTVHCVSSVLFFVIKVLHPQSVNYIGSC